MSEHTHDLSDRVTRLEVQMIHEVEAMKKNTEAVERLTIVLERSRGIFWFIGVIGAFSAAVGGFVAWMLTTFHLSAHP